MLALVTAQPGLAQRTDAAPQTALQQEPSEPTGDRVMSAIRPETAAPDAARFGAVRLSPDYRIGPGDLLTVRVTGRVDLHYGQQAQAGVSRLGVNGTPDTYTVMPDGLVHLPMIGAVEASGRTVGELRELVTQKLSAYFKHFTVDMSVAQPGVIKVWVSGQVANPGPQTLPSTATVLEALLRAGILSNGSTRLVKLRRGGQTQLVDVYDIVARGALEAYVVLEAGDEIYVPAAVDWVTVEGEVSRPGRFEMAVPNRPGGKFRLSDLVDLCLGLLPTAAPANAIIERPVSSGEVKAIHVDLAGKDDPELQPGDKLVVPSIADYQPTIRLVGEFKGEGVYQRVAGTVLNKSGVYRLAKGETAGDVIVRTGGTTPQADLRRARIERRRSGKIEILPLDLERVLTYQDKSADVVLESGDTVVLPALMDKVYVFGQVVTPGGVPYEPDRRLLEYLAGAGGPTGRAKSSVLIVRGNPDKPEVIRVNMTRGMVGQERDNPILQPGDVVYVPQKVVTDWRDVAQIISTVRLLTLF